MTIASLARYAHPGALAGQPVDWAGARRVLVVRPDNLGDVLLLTPALRALRRAAPAARITLLASPGGAAAVPLLVEVDDVLVCAPSWQVAGRAAPAPDPDAELELVGRVAAGRFDVSLIFTSFSQSPWPAGYVCLLAGVPVRAGLSKEFGGALLTHWVPAPPDELHQADRALHLLAALGVAPAGPDLDVRLPPGARAAARASRTAAGIASGAPYAVLLPGASCSSRRYSPGRFAEVARRVAAAGPHVLVAGPDRERALVEEVARGAGPGVFPLAGGLDVPGLAALLADADLAVCNNSGGMHLSDAVGTPLVVTFAGTELEEQYRPRGTDAVLLRRPTTCSPCRTFVCPFAHECLDLDPARVAAAAIHLLAGKSEDAGPGARPHPAGIQGYGSGS